MSELRTLMPSCVHFSSMNKLDLDPEIEMQGRVRSAPARAIKFERQEKPSASCWKTVPIHPCPSTTAHTQVGWLEIVLMED